MKTSIISVTLVVFTLVLLCLGQIALAEEVISLPWTGQEKCYNSSGAEISCAGTRQDGDVQEGVDWPSPRFTVTGDCVTDNLTGLMWPKNANLANKMGWNQALDYVASINSGSGLCGYKDWHLPNINELESLVDTGEANIATWLMSQGFSNVQGNYYWSSTTWVHAPEAAWPVHMLDGSIDMYNLTSTVPIHSKGNSYYVWPVREDAAVDEAPARVWKTGQTAKYYSGDDGDLEKGVAWPSPRFTDHGDGTVTDNLTGLMWSKDADVMGATTWQAALDYVKTLNTAKYSDWRLPNRKELLSLIDRSKFEPPLPDQLIFSNVRIAGWNCYYWMSTTNANHTTNAWDVGMVGGAVEGIYNKTSPANPIYVWPVRSAQGPSNNPVISVAPNPVDFGTVSVGAFLDKSITVKNTGNADLVIGTITSPSSLFTMPTDDCSDKTLSFGQTCTVTYSFIPTSEGSFSSSSSIPSNDPARNQLTVTLKGQTGVISLSSPTDGSVFDCCSLSTPPVFHWSSKESFKGYEVQFSRDQGFSLIPVVVKPKGSATEATPTSATWKKILMVPGTAGGNVYWQVKGKRADRTTTLSKASSLEIEQPEPAGDEALSSTSKSSLPKLSWDNNCNNKFKVWFGSDLQFSNKKSFSFSLKNPAETFEVGLTSSQWGSIRKLVGDATGATIYWYVESWDGLGRYAKTDVNSFVLTD